MTTRNQNDIFNDITSLKAKMSIKSTELETFLQYLDQSVFVKRFMFCGPAKVEQSPEFTRAFNTLDNIQKADYYLCCLRQIYSINKLKDVTVVERPLQQLEVYYRINHAKDWKTANIVLDYHMGTILIQNLGQTLKIQNYIIRNSKCKDRNAFALQCCRGKNAIQTLRLSHSDIVIHNDLQNKIKSMVIESLRNKFENMMGVCLKNGPCRKSLQKKDSVSVEITTSNERKSLRQLIQQSNTSINITMQQYASIASNLFNKELILNLDNFAQYQEVSEGIFIHNTKNRIRKNYLFPSEQYSKDWLIKQLTQFENFKIWKSSLFMISLLADIPNEQSKIFHEISMYKDSTECDYVYLRHFFVVDQVSYFIDKSISTKEYGSHETLKSRAKIQYCLWRIRECKNKYIQVTVQCQIYYPAFFDIYEAISQQIGQFENVIHCKNFNRKPNKLSPQLFKSSLSVISSFQDVKQFNDYIHNETNQEKDMTQFYSIRDSQYDLGEKKDQEVWEFSDKAKCVENKTQIIEITPKYRYQISPVSGNEKIYKQFKGDIFFDPAECVSNSKGQLVFVNQLKIKAQSSVLKTVLKKIGSNFFSGKSILNISLPIQIFSAQTNLERLCKANAYAPIFLENLTTQSPIKRMIATIGYSIGNILLYIEMSKPFNPILGETYQGFIDGCPIYGQQISHHPPISTLFMVGRGYFITANLEAKVEFGLNNASGINEGIYNVAFHQTNPKENIVQFTGPPGELSGVVYGQRKLALIKKTRYFDQKNQLFCQISWGKSKSKNQLSRYADFMEGNIIKLKNYQTDMKNIKTSNQDEILGNVYGRWADKIYFNQQIIIDVNRTKCFRVAHQPQVLPSDGILRKDLIVLSQGRLDQAQNAKQQLEELQRYDRKLRKQYCK